MKKLLCAILTLMMIVTAALPTFAEVTQIKGVTGYSAISEVTIPSDAKDIKDLDIDKSDFSTTIVNISNFKITDEEGWIKFAKIVGMGNSTDLTKNSFDFEGQTVYLANDLDFINYDDILPVGEDEKHVDKSGTENSAYGVQIDAPASFRDYFAGTFEGGGHCIKNLKMTSQTSEYVKGNVVALFKAISDGAVIQNLVIDGSCSFTNTTSNGTQNGSNAAHGQGNIAASLVGYAYGNSGSKVWKISNVISYATVTCGTKINSNSVGRFDNAGGIIGACYTNNGQDQITNCTFAGKITAAGDNAGGIIGYLCSASMKISNCLNAGEINAQGNAGGIVGGDYKTTSAVSGYHMYCYIVNCVNVGAINGDANSGAFFGYATAKAHASSKIQLQQTCVNSYGAVNEYNGTVDVSHSSLVIHDYTSTVDNSGVKYYGFQKSNESEGASNRSVRIIGTISNELMEANAVGFKVTVVYNGHTQINSSSDTIVYKSLVQMSNDQMIEEHAPENEYFFAVVLKDMPTSFGEISVVVTPYYLDGETECYGKTEVINVDLTTSAPTEITKSAQ